MSLHPHVVAPVPAETARVAHAAFPKGHPYLTCRDALGRSRWDALSRGDNRGCPARLALVTIMQFRENLADRQAAVKAMHMEILRNRSRLAASRMPCGGTPVLMHPDHQRPRVVLRWLITVIAHYHLVAPLPGPYALPSAPAV